MFNNSKIKFTCELNYEQLKEVISFMEKVTLDFIIKPTLSFIRFHGDKGDYLISIKFNELDGINSIKISTKEI